MSEWILPTQGTLTCDYACHVAGNRTPGLDLANTTGTPIVAAKDGVVRLAQHFNPTAGNYVEVDEGKSVSRYLHLMRIDVTVGQVVAQGGAIGPMGSTGNSTGPHLHWDCGFKAKADALAIQPDPYLQYGLWFVDPQKLINMTPQPAPTPDKPRRIDMRVVKSTDTGTIYVIGATGKITISNIQEAATYLAAAGQDDYLALNQIQIDAVRDAK